MDRKQPMPIPGLLRHFRDVDVTKVEDGMKTCEVIDGSREREYCRQAYETDEHSAVPTESSF